MRRVWRARTASTAVAAGTTMPGTAGRPSASGIRRATAMATWACVRPAHAARSGVKRWSGFVGPAAVSSWAGRPRPRVTTAATACDAAREAASKERGEGGERCARLPTLAQQADTTHEPPAMKTHLLTLCFDVSRGAFDDGPLRPDAARRGRPLRGALL